MTFFEWFDKFMQALLLVVEDMAKKLPDWLKVTKDKVKEFIGDQAKAWWAKTVYVTKWTIIASLVLVTLAFIIGYYQKTGMYFAIAGLGIGVILLIMLIYWTPLAVVVGVIVELKVNVVSSGEKYVKWWMNFILGVLIYELIICFAFSVLPFWNDMARIPLIALSALIITLMGVKWGNPAQYTKALRAIVVLVLVANITVLVFPTAKGQFTGQSFGANVQEHGLAKGVYLTVFDGFWKPNTDKYWDRTYLGGGTYEYTMRKSGDQVPLHVVPLGKAVMITAVSAQNITLGGVGGRGATSTLAQRGHLVKAATATLALEVSGYAKGDIIRITPADTT